VVIVKHNNPCGIGRGADLAEAYARAVATDPVSAYGSVIALNRPADGALAAAMADLFVEVLLAPGFDADARARFGAKKNLRLIECPLYAPAPDAVELRAIDGGFLAQPPDAFPDDPAVWTCPTKRQPTAEERRALEFAWRVVRYVKSNAIVVANADQTVGIGLGRLLPLPRRPRRARPGGDHGGGPAGREQEGRRDRGGDGRGGDGDGDDGGAALPALKKKGPHPTLSQPSSHPCRGEGKNKDGLKRGLLFSLLSPEGRVEGWERRAGVVRALGALREASPLPTCFEARGSKEDRPP
jgi:hypothetical protein